MKVLMFGWEFPPVKTGGLGTACYGLTKGLANEGIDVTFVVPFDANNCEASFVKLKGMPKIHRIHSILSPYQTAGSYAQIRNAKTGEIYGQDLFYEVDRYARVASEFMNKEYDIIHAHDWMTYKAAILAKKRTKRPIIAHIHATEYDRTAGNPNLQIARLEKEGLAAADRVIANSQRLKNEVVKNYGISPSKIDVVHWGIDQDDPGFEVTAKPAWKGKTVLFLGRITIQKGPEYFVELASRVLTFYPDVHFVMVGTGDMLPQVINHAVDLGISDKISFTGALKGEDVHRAFHLADLFVMPSVSEPFGLVALESMRNGTPCILSQQSGVSEVVRNCFKTDFWDIDKMTNYVVACLRHPEVLEELSEKSIEEASQFTLDVPAKKIINSYLSVTVK